MLIFPVLDHDLQYTCLQNLKRVWYGTGAVVSLEFIIILSRVCVGGAGGGGLDWNRCPSDCHAVHVSDFVRTISPELLNRFPPNLVGGELSRDGV